MEVGDIMFDITERKNSRWYGRVRKMGNDRMFKAVLNWTVKGRRKKERPKIRWFDCVQHSMERHRLQPEGAEVQGESIIMEILGVSGY